MDGLPPDWSLERIRRIEAQSELLDVTAHSVCVQEGENLRELRPRCIISFAGLCLVNPADDNGWYMGQLDRADGSITCWGSYGTDLAEAIASL